MFREHHRSHHRTGVVRHPPCTPRIPVGAADGGCRSDTGSCDPDTSDRGRLSDQGQPQFCGPFAVTLQVEGRSGLAFVAGDRNERKRARPRRVRRGGRGRLRRGWGHARGGARRRGRGWARACGRGRGDEHDRRHHRAGRRRDGGRDGGRCFTWNGRGALGGRAQREDDQRAEHSSRHDQRGDRDAGESGHAGTPRRRRSSRRQRRSRSRTACSRASTRATRASAVVRSALNPSTSAPRSAYAARKSTCSAWRVRSARADPFATTATRTLAKAVRPTPASPSSAASWGSVRASTAGGSPTGCGAGVHDRYHVRDGL